MYKRQVYEKEDHFKDQPMFMAMVSPRSLHLDTKPVRPRVKNIYAITAENLDTSVETVNGNSTIRKLIIQKTCKAGRSEILCLPQHREKR